MWSQTTRQMADSTIAPPPKPTISLTDVSWLFDTTRRCICYAKNIFMYFLVDERVSNDDVGVARAAIFQEIRPKAGFKTGDFVEKMLGGLPWED